MRMSPAAQSYTQLGVMLFTNLLFCWFPIYYWSTYTANDNRDGNVLLIGLLIALITWFLAPPVGYRLWRLSTGLPSPLRLRHRISMLLMCCGIFSPLWIIWTIFHGLR